MATKDGTLPQVTEEELVERAAAYEPLVPSAVVDFHLRKAGCVLEEEDLLSVVGLATQKFIFDVVQECASRWHVREKGLQKAEKRKAGADGDVVGKKPRLTTRDLDPTLTNMGISSGTPPYFLASSRD